MADVAQDFNGQSGFNWQDFWLHALLIIPIEFGILHSTPLGPMLHGFFDSLWSGLGMEFAAEAGAHVAGEALAEEAVSGMCHMHGAELVCH